MSDRHFVLVVSRNLPPAVTGSAVIVGNLARAFSREEMLLAGRRPGATPSAQMATDRPEVVYLEGRHDWQSRVPGGRHLPLATVPWLTRRLVRLIRRRGCTDVLGVYPDMAYLWAAWQASRQTGCRFYPWFHNTLLESRGARRIAGWERRLATWLQTRVFRDATHVFVMSDGMLELYRERYPHLRSCSALVHSFAEPIPPFAEPGMRAEPVFAFSGNVNGSCLEAARRLCEVVGRVPGAQLHFYTVQSQADLEQFGVWQPNATCSRLDRPALLAALAQSDILLLPHGFTGPFHEVEYQTIFPTKTIEYLISGRPILAHTPPGVLLTRFLKQHDCALVVEEASPRAVQASIEQLRQDPALRSRLVRNALQAAERFQITRVAGHLRQKVGVTN